MRRWILLGAWCSGCYTGVDRAGGDVDPPWPPADDVEEPDGGDGPEREPSGEEPPPEACDGQGEAQVRPLRRLTRAEYNNTVRDLLGDASRPADAFPEDEAVAGFAANAVSPISALELDQILAAAEGLARDAVSDRWATVVGCAASDRPCLGDWVEDFGRRAFRRPLSAGERSGYEALLDDATAEWGAETGVELTLAAMLQSPNFLYHHDIQPAYGTASRLSYFAWQSMPDEALFDAAAAGELEAVQQREQQTRRMLDDPRALDAVGSFHIELLHLSGLHRAFKDPAVFPEWDESLAEAMRDETAKWSAAVVLEGDASLRTLLTASWTVVDEELAALYGVSATESGRVELDPEERAGLLTHPSVLASTAGAAENSWIHRGKLVREQVLCRPLQPPPPEVDASDSTSAQRLEDPYCATCHVLMDPIGEGFDDYSPIGVYSAQGARGDVRAIDGLGEFEGVVDLAHQLAASPVVHDCFADQWFRYATRRQPTDAETCALEDVRDAFSASGHDIRELIITLGGQL